MNKIQMKLAQIQWMKDIMKPKMFLVLGFLIAMGDSLSANTQLLVEQGKINPRDRVLAVRSIVTAGGTIDLLQAYRSAVKGINDFNGNQLANNINFVLDSLQFNYGTGVTATIGDKYDNVEYTTTLPSGLKCATLIIEQEDKVIRRIPIAAIHESKSTDARWFELDGFALLKADALTAIKIEFGQNAALSPGATNSSYVEVLLKGYETATTY